MKTILPRIFVIFLMELAGVHPSIAQEQTEPIDFFTANTVTVELGKEGIDDGLKHHHREPDGRTTIENLDGVTCRHLDLKSEGKSFGYLYFAIHPDFKERELKTARIDVEYLITNRAILRLQYDANVGDEHKPYKGMPAQGGEKVMNDRFTRVQGTNVWQKATFYIADGAFMNSQNGRADFRLEVAPPEIHVRRVTVTRQDLQTPPRQPGQSDE